MRLPRTDHRNAAELQLTPMIDVVFLLLIFFVWTSSFELPEFDLPSAIAETSAGASPTNDEQPRTEPFDELVVRLSSNNSSVAIELNGQLLSDVNELRRRLEAILALGVQPPVIIDPAPDITMNLAVQVYDHARLAGADRVLFAARPEEE
jgi:biopolymer transport protein ExbD